MKRISGYITEELFSDIEEEAKRESRRITPMISLLLRNAINERKRKRKKIPAQHNPADLGTSNPK